MTAARTTISKHYRRRGRSTAAFHHSAPTTTQTAGTTAICSASVSYLSTLKNYFQDSCQADYLKIYRTTGLIELWLRMTNLKLVFFDPSKDVVMATNFYRTTTDKTTKPGCG